MPFIQLNQESFEGTLSELDSLITAVNGNDVESVKEILQTNPEKQHEYVLELCRLAEEYIESERTVVANNTINVLVNIHDAVEDPSREGITKLLDKFMTGSEILSNLMMFDVDILFPITLSLNSDVGETIHRRYAQNMSAPNYAPMIIKKFIDNIASISDSVCQDVDENLGKLGGLNHVEQFYYVLERLMESSTAAEKFAKKSTLREVISLIHPSTEDRWMSAYMKLKHLAGEDNKLAFVEKMLSAIKTEEGQNMPPDSETVCRKLMEMTADDFAGGAAKYTYDSLKKPALDYADTGGRALVSAIILKAYTKLDHPDREEFATEILSSLIAQISPEQISPIVKIVRDENVPILEFAPVADAVFSLLRDNPSRESVDLLYAGTSEDKWEDLEDRIINIHSEDVSRVSILSSAFDLSASAPVELRARIFRRILQSCEQFDHDAKLSIYQNLAKNLDGLGKTPIDALADGLLQELRPDDNVQVDACLELISGCFGKTTEAKQMEVISNLLTKVQEYMQSKPNFAIAVIRFLISKNKDMVRDGRGQFVDFAVKTLESEDNVPVLTEILDQFDSIEFGDRREYAYELVAKLCESSNEDVKSKAQEIING